MIDSLAHDQSDLEEERCSMIDFLPGWTFKDLGPDGGPYDETGHPKVVIHTTEGSTLSGAEAAFAAYPPHLGYDPINRLKHQYVRLDRHSYALRGDESDDEFAVQIEIVGFASQAHLWSDQVYRNIAEDVIRPLRNAIRVPDQHLRFYRADEGIVLATATSPIRLNDTAFRNFSGWLGHQHVPAPDVHWDPGGFLIDKALQFSQEENVDERSIAVEIWDGTVLDGKTPRQRIEQIEGFGARTEDTQKRLTELQTKFSTFTESTDSQLDALKSELSQIKATLAEIRTMIGTGFTLTPSGQITVTAETA